MFILLINGFMINCFAEGVSYSSDYFERGAGITNDGHLIFVEYFFSIECFFESSNMSISMQRNYTYMIEAYINYFIRQYIVIYISQFSVLDINFCQNEFYNEFMEYVSDKLNEIILDIVGLNYVQITKLEILENPETMANRLRQIEQ